MGTTGLDAALTRGAPLVEIVVRFREGIDAPTATRAFNELGDDINLASGAWYDDPLLRVGSTTKEALVRLFGWYLTRVPLERYDAETDTWGHWPDVYRWEVIGTPAFYPESVRDLVASISVTQPGQDDNGQWYE